MPIEETARGRRDPVLPAHLDRPLRAGGIGSADLATISAARRHRQHPPRAPRRRPTRSRPGLGVAEQLPDGDDHEVAERVALEAPVPAKRCCSTSRQVCPQSLSSQSAASAMRRSPREDVELLTQAPARAAVVGDGHHGGRRRSAAGGRTGQREPVPTAERDDAALVWRAEGCAWRGHGRYRSPVHSRPRSRWTTKVSTRSRPPESPAQRLGDATDRACHRLQPDATVT